MSEQVAKKKSIGLSILKVSAIVVLSIVVIVVAIYLYVRFYLGVNLPKVKAAIDLINKDYSQSQVVTEGFNNDDVFQGFYKLYGENNVYVLKDGKYIFNKDEFVVSTLQGDTELTNKEFAGILNLYIQNFIAEDLSSGDISGNANLRQIDFSNLREEANSFLVDVKFVFEIKLYDSTDDEFFASILKSFIPKKIFITCNSSLTISKEDCFDCAFSVKDFKINNLSREETNAIFEAFDFLNAGTLKEEIINDVNKLFFSSIYGTDTVEGLVEKINEAVGFGFASYEENILFCVKKV